MRRELTRGVTVTCADDGPKSRFVRPAFGVAVEEVDIFTAIECGFRMPWVELKTDGYVVSSATGGGAGSPFATVTVKSPDGESRNFRIDGRDVVQRALAYTRSTPETTDDELLRTGVRNAGRNASKPAPRWSHVAEAFGQGSTSAAALCRRFDLDPDEVLGAWPEEEEPDVS